MHIASLCDEYCSIHYKDIAQKGFSGPVLLKVLAELGSYFSFLLLHACMVVCRLDTQFVQNNCSVAMNGRVLF